MPNPAETDSVFSGGVAHPNDDIDTVGNRACRQIWQRLNGKLGSLDVPEFTGIDIVEMMMIAGIRVIKHPRRVYDDLADQPLASEQTQRVIDRRLGNMVVAIIHIVHYLVRAEVLDAIEQDTCNHQPLAGWKNIAAFQQAGQLMWAKHLSLDGFFHRRSIIRNPPQRLRREAQADGSIYLSIA